MNAITIWAEMRIEGAHLSLLSPLYLIVPVALSLAFLKNRWWHATCLIAFSGFYLTQLFGHELS